MFFRKKDQPAPQWRDGVFLCTAANSMDADIIESKLRAEGIPSERKYDNAGNFLEIAMGSSTFPIDIYVPEQAAEDAKNIIVAIPLASGEAVDFDELTEDELEELIGGAPEGSAEGEGAEGEPRGADGARL